MGIWRPTVLDDRGVRVGCTLPAAESSGGERAGRLLAAWDGTPRRLSRQEKRRVALYGLVALPILLPIGISPAMVPRLGLPAWLFLPLIVPAAVVPPLAVAFLFMRRVMPERLAEQYRNAGYCGSCAYDLRGVEPAADACRVCPECGSAWRTIDPGPSG